MSRPASVVEPSILLLGFTVDDALISEVAALSAVLPTQTHNFAWNLVSALRTGGSRVGLLSALPVPSYPEYPRVFVSGGVVTQRGVSGLTIRFVNVLVLKHITRLYACFTTGNRFVSKTRPDVIVVHGVHTPFLLFARFLKSFRNKRICVVLTDPPGVVRPSDGRIAKALKRLDRGVVRRLCAGFDGTFALTSDLARDFAPGVPTLIMEGFATPVSLPDRQMRSGQDYVLAYAGGLNEEYGVRNLVLAVQNLEDPRIRLDLYGRGPLEGWIKESALRDPRIRYRGVVDQDRLLPLLASADLLLNPRQVHQEFVKYSFPSKLLEYMSLGVPVITTRLPGIPGGYEPYLSFIEDDSPEGIATKIHSVMSEDPRSRELRAEAARKFVEQEKSTVVQGTRITAFLHSMMAAHE